MYIFYIHITIEMNTGLTITCISADKQSSTFKSFQKFGNKYWDDTETNKSKIGYYFAYYFQKKYVYFHKIINILPPSKRPTDMIWDSNRNILCLGKRLKEFTWEEWKTFTNNNAPYTPDYRINKTSSWPINELRFNFNELVEILSLNENETNIIPKPITLTIKDNTNILFVDDDDYEEQIEREMEIQILKLKEIAENKLRRARENRIKKNTILFREKYVNKIKDENNEIEQQIIKLITIQDANKQKMLDIAEGKYDNEFVATDVELTCINET
jgi:hypothetical protein